jgi:cell division protein FtsL
MKLSRKDPTRVPGLGPGGKDAKPAPRSGSRRRASTAVFLLATLGVTLAALGHVAVQAKIVEVQLVLSAEGEKNEALKAERRRLELLVVELKDPGRLMEEGRKRGMIAVPAAIRVITRPRQEAP